jgi:hypothetical protein
MLIELILANGIQYLRKNKFAGMDENIWFLFENPRNYLFLIQIVKSKDACMLLYIKKILNIYKI